MESEFPGDDLTQRASYLIDPHQLCLQKPSEQPLTYSNENQIAVEFALQQNYPNPFNSDTEIKYQLPQSCKVTIEIYNSLGQKIRTMVSKAQPAGFYSVVWDGRNEHGIPVASGIYLYLIRANQYHEVKKMLLLR